MHYFKMNIGDYAKKAGRLSMLEHGAYTLLIHSCYDREQFPTLDEAIDWCWARTDEEISAVKFVLGKFFNLIDGVYVQSRISEEVAKYQENSLTNKRIAQEREDKRKGNTARTVHEPCKSVNEPPPNQEPRTKNQEPLTINQEPEDKTHTDYPSQQSGEESENNSQQEESYVDKSKHRGKPTPAASVCLAIKKMGIIDINPSHPELAELIRVGATVDEFVYAARTAKDKGKGFRYVLGIVKGQREEALKTSEKVLHGTLKNKADRLLENNLNAVSDWVPPDMRATK